VYWIVDQVEGALGRRQEVCETTNRLIVLPLAKNVGDKTSFKLALEKHAPEVVLGDDANQEKNGDVRGVEKFDGVFSIVVTGALALQLKLNSEVLEHVYDEANDNCRNKVRQIGRVLAEKGIIQRV
jgi:hypothetical protein